MTPFIAFLVVAVVVIVTPGPDTALTIRNTLRGGRRGGVFTAVGVVTGQAIWALATSVGLAALLAAWSEIFAAIRFAGAIYLVSASRSSSARGGPRVREIRRVSRTASARCRHASPGNRVS